MPNSEATPDFAFIAGFVVAVVVWLAEPDWKKGGLFAVLAVALIIFAAVRHPAHFLARTSVAIITVGIFIWLILPTLWNSFHKDHPNVAFSWPITFTGPINQDVAPSDILDVTPSDLMALYKSVMSSEGDRLLEPYVGKWMRLSPTVSDVKANSVWTYSREKPDSEPRLILLLFDNATQLGVLRHDQQISALCQIAGAKVDAVFLNHCKLENR